MNGLIHKNEIIKNEDFKKEKRGLCNEKTLTASSSKKPKGLRNTFKPNC